MRLITGGDSSRRWQAAKASTAAWKLVLESPVRSGYLAPRSSHRDQDWLAFPRKPRITGPDQSKPVRGQLGRLFIGYKTGC